LSDWLRDCLYPPPPTIVKVPELSIYHSQTAPDRFYVDPNDLQDLMQQYEITQLTDVIRPEVKLSITPKSSDEFNPTFLPPHAIYRRTMALLAPPVQGARAFGNPLYNTTLEGLIYRPAYWKIDYNVRDELSLLDRSAFQDTVRREIQPDSLAFPGLYTFECRDTSYSVLDSEGERRGVMVVLPDLTTTHRLTSLDRAVSDLNFHHEIHLDSTYEIRTEEIPRFVQSDQISVEIEANSRELISVEIGMAGEEKPLFCRKIIVSSPLKAGENPIVVARRLEHVHPRRHLKIIENNPVAIAYFRYVSPEGQPLQPELGVKVDGKYWHEVYIHGWKPGDEAKPVMKKDVSWWVTAFLGLSGSLLMLASI